MINLPEQIDRSLAIEAVRSLGLDPHQLSEVHLRRHDVAIVVHEKDDNGRDIVDGEHNCLVKRWVELPYSDASDA